MQTQKKALVLGATGLVGSYIVQNLLERENYHVVVLVRKSMGLVHARLEEIIVDFNELDKIQLNKNIDEYYCALGTTMAKAKTKDNFFRVDYTYAIEGAKLALRHNAKSIGLISALGASSNSFFYYNKVKGKLEDAISKQAWDDIVIARPSLILGDRKDARLLENLSKNIFDKLSFGLKLFSSKLMPVHAKKIADRTIEEIGKNRKEKKVLYFKD